MGIPLGGYKIPVDFLRSMPEGVPSAFVLRMNDAITESTGFILQDISVVPPSTLDAHVVNWPQSKYFWLLLADRPGSSISWAGAFSRSPQIHPKGRLIDSGLLSSADRIDLPPPEWVELSIETNADSQGLRVEVASMPKVATKEFRTQLAGKFGQSMSGVNFYDAGKTWVAIPFTYR